MLIYEGLELHGFHYLGAPTCSQCHFMQGELAKQSCHDVNHFCNGWDGMATKQQLILMKLKGKL